MKRPDRGFTLIEVMIVVTVIATLAAIAIPVYQNYVTRTKVSEGFRLAGPAKVAVTEHYELEGEFPADNEAASLPAPADIRGRYTQSVEIIEDGQILVTFDDPALIGQTLTLKPTPSGHRLIWSCTTTLPANLTPQACR